MDGRVSQLERNMAMVQQRHLEQAGLESTWNEENYTISEYPVSIHNFIFAYILVIKFFTNFIQNFQSHTNSPDHPFEKSSEDYDFVDVEGDVCMEAELSGRPVAMKKDVLEEGNFYLFTFLFLN